MSEFKREERFIVIKRKYLTAESRFYDSTEQELRVWLDKHCIPTSECVVVESDWPEYETVWAMLAARAEVRPTPYQVLEQQVAALRQHKTDYMEAAEGTRRALETEAKLIKNKAARYAACLWDYFKTCPECGNSDGHLPGCAKTYEREFKGPADYMKAFDAMLAAKRASGDSHE